MPKNKHNGKIYLPHGHQTSMIEAIDAYMARKEREREHIEMIVEGRVRHARIARLFAEAKKRMQ